MASGCQGIGNRWLCDPLTATNNFILESFFSPFFLHDAVSGQVLAETDPAIFNPPNADFLKLFHNQVIIPNTELDIRLLRLRGNLPSHLNAGWARLTSSFDQLKSD